MDNYGGSADQLVIMQTVTYNWPGQTWLWYQKGGKLHKLRIRRLELANYFYFTFRIYLVSEPSRLILSLCNLPPFWYQSQVWPGQL